MDEPKKYNSAEQALVEELGAIFVGTLEKLGEFLIMAGDENHKDLAAQSVAWLVSKNLLSTGASWSERDAVDALTGNNGVDIRVECENGWTEYHFVVLPDGTPSAKHYHMVEVSVLIPPHCCGGGHEMGA